jgi:hypothetical protein
MRRVDLTGRRFGMLTAIRFDGCVKNNTRWICLCDCGDYTRVFYCNLVTGNTQSCGCQEGKHIHGGAETVEYGIWCAMKRRCGFNPDYSGRGIRLCERYMNSFGEFIADVGKRPSAKYSIERIDNNRGYSCGKCEDCKARGEPANCKWATKAEQVRNTRANHFITFEDQTLTLAEWSRKTGILGHTILTRLKAGWPLNEALLTPPVYSYRKRKHKRPLPCSRDEALRSALRHIPRLQDGNDVPG